MSRRDPADKRKESLDQALDPSVQRARDAYTREHPARPRAETGTPPATKQRAPQQPKVVPATVPTASAPFRATSLQEQRKVDEQRLAQQRVLQRRTEEQAAQEAQRIKAATEAKRRAGEEKKARDHLINPLHQLITDTNAAVQLENQHYCATIARCTALQIPLSWLENDDSAPHSTPKEKKKAAAGSQPLSRHTVVNLRLLTRIQHQAHLFNEVRTKPVKSSDLTQPMADITAEVNVIAFAIHTCHSDITNINKALDALKELIAMASEHGEAIGRFKQRIAKILHALREENPPKNLSRDIEELVADIINETARLRMLTNVLSQRGTTERTELEERAGIAFAMAFALFTAEKNKIEAEATATRTAEENRARLKRAFAAWKIFVAERPKHRAAASVAPEHTESPPAKQRKKKVNAHPDKRRATFRARVKSSVKVKPHSAETKQDAAAQTTGEPTPPPAVLQPDFMEMFSQRLAENDAMLRQLMLQQEEDRHTFFTALQDSQAAFLTALERQRARNTPPPTAAVESDETEQRRDREREEEEARAALERTIATAQHEAFLTQQRELFQSAHDTRSALERAELANREAIERDSKEGAAMLSLSQETEAMQREIDALQSQQDEFFELFRAETKAREREATAEAAERDALLAASKAAATTIMSVEGKGYYDDFTSPEQKRSVAEKTTQKQPHFHAEHARGGDFDTVENREEWQWTEPTIVSSPIERSAESPATVERKNRATTERFDTRTEFTCRGTPRAHASEAAASAEKTSEITVSRVAKPFDPKTKSRHIIWQMTGARGLSLEVQYEELARKSILFKITEAEIRDAEIDFLEKTEPALFPNDRDRLATLRELKKTSDPKMGTADIDVPIEKEEDRDRKENKKKNHKISDLGDAFKTYPDQFYATDAEFLAIKAHLKYYNTVIFHDIAFTKKPAALPSLAAGPHTLFGSTARKASLRKTYEDDGSRPVMIEP